MKTYLPPSVVRILALLLTLSLLCALIACSTNSDNVTTGGSGNEEAATLPPITLPDLTDDRELSDTSLYVERLESLFASATPIPETDLTYEITEAGVTVTGYTGGELILVIPDSIEGRPVTAIAAAAFKDMSSLKAVSIPDTVTSIGKAAFEGCKNLTSMKTPVYTGEDAPYFGALFGAASHETNGGYVPAKLSTLVLTAGESIPDYAFYACRGLEAVSLPDTVTEIGDFAFYGCEGLAYIAIRDTATVTVGEHAFAGCVCLLELSLPNTVTYMGSGMVEGCGKLESLTIPFVGGCTVDHPLTEEEMTAIEKGEMQHPAESTAYLGYLFGASHYTFTAGYIPASLMRVTVTAGCTDIPANAFFECLSLREIYLPEGVTAIGRRAFYGCEWLTAMTLPDSVLSIGDDAFNGCIRLQTFAAGAGLTNLGVQAFMGCLSLKTVTLPTTVTYLPNSCFSGCLSLKTLTAGGVASMGDRVFHQCDNLTGWEK